ncbi:class II aldolase/adducin family protein [Pseudonocardia kunmingensis]|jgi:ribulose-5-phosphate 4-epimerase/fuculose-1-phosphate aldolase|uniref:L-fuculose-phosphate aldolase n=1 Tax=Pseudonocardia kunmingensis TaxID=630975 RepID=A0A543DNY1_9PSEU|nr:class II aldolase/adducin family protein [Pseudonocardia kunmingensis]TQM11018.1 L-fuculose-phosphate aldolase [Pseudonocardia kunmingensis]
MAEHESPARQAAEANQALAVAGHADMVWGHATVRDPEGRGVWMKAAGWAFEEVTDERVLLVSPDGDVLAGEGNRHFEYPIHTEIMAARPDVGAVVHSHATGAVAFASLDVPLRAVSHDAVSFLDPDVPRFTLTSNLITDAKLGAALAEALGDAAGVLIPGHGLVTVGENAAAAVMRAVLLNRACHTQLQAIQAGGPAVWTCEEEARAKRETVVTPAFLAAGYDYLVRRARAGQFPITGI